jgi:hypothetical protein
MPDVLLLAFALPANRSTRSRCNECCRSGDISVLPRAEYAWLGNKTESTAVQCGMFAAIVSFEGKLH